MSVDLGTGTTIVFGTSGFTAEITDISWSGISREIIDTTHLGTSPASGSEIGSKTFLAGDLTDPGEISLEGHFDPDQIPPLEAAAETVTITFPLPVGGTTAATWAASCQLTSYDPSIPLEDKMTFSATLKVVGPITVTASN